MAGQAPGSLFDMTRNFSYVSGMIRGAVYDTNASTQLRCPRGLGLQPPPPPPKKNTLHGWKSPKGKIRHLLPSLNANQALDQETKTRIIRAKAAQANSFENIGFFATAGVAANVAKGE